MSILLPEESQFIVIGAWNPAIIQPQWLKKEFPSLIPDKFSIQFVAGPISGIQMDFEKIILDPNGGRLLFIPKKIDKETLSYIAELSNGLQDRLHHTPIAAAGCNFVFKLDEAETFTLDDLEGDAQISGLYPFLKDLQLVTKLVRHTFSAEDHSINIFYDYKGGTKLLRINYDYQQPTNQMKKAADSLLDNFKHAQEISKKLIRGK